MANDHCSQKLRVKEKLQQFSVCRGFFGSHKGTRMVALWLVTYIYIYIYGSARRKKAVKVYGYGMKGGYKVSRYTWEYNAPKKCAGLGVRGSLYSRGYYKSLVQSWVYNAVPIQRDIIYVGLRGRWKNRKKKKRKGVEKNSEIFTRQIYTP